MNTAAAKHRVAKIFRNGYFIFGICAPLSETKHYRPEAIFSVFSISRRGDVVNNISSKKVNSFCMHRSCKKSETR